MASAISSHTLQLSSEQQLGRTVTRSVVSVPAAKLIREKPPSRVFRLELNGEYAERLVTSTSKWNAPDDRNTVPTFAKRMSCGLSNSGPAPPRLE